MSSLAQICLASHYRRWAEHLNNLGNVAAWEAMHWAKREIASLPLAGEVSQGTIGWQPCRWQQLYHIPKTRAS